MKRLRVIYEGWGERFDLGLLADDGRRLLFEYTPAALERGLQLSPFRLPLQAAAFGDFPPHQHRLPGLVSDSLPDGWGMLLMDRLFRSRGIELARVSPLDRLAVIGHTFNAGPAGEHQMDICGEARAPARAHLLKLADMGGLNRKAAADTIDRIAECAAGLSALASTFPITSETVGSITSAVELNRARVATETSQA